VPDILCGAPLNDRDDVSPFLEDTGALYIIYGRTPTGDINLALAGDPGRRPPMLRVRGEKPGDQIGWKQEPVRDVDGDSVDDVLFSSPFADFIIPPGECRGDFDGDGDIDDDDLNENLFNNCMAQVGVEVFLDDACKVFDYNNDRVIDDFDRVVFNCLVETGGSSTCCPVDNGYVGIIYGAQDRDGDRTIGQLATTALRGTIFFGSNRGDRAGQDIASAGDFDKDGFGDILITAPGEIRTDDNERERMGVTYLVFGGPHLVDQEIDLADVGPGKLFRGLVFLSPYVTGRPDEAPTDSVGLLGDINADGFSDIAIGVTRADLIDEDFPQGGDEPGIGRRPDQGDAYIIYGNNVSAD
ncbi:MAG: FG-GAP repeat protein, partial [Planctomycetes bacterium]|nr:FG-GAP repeat protein [Planctomycetota bacterium]